MNYLPVYLMADSRLLFQQQKDGSYYLASIRNELESKDPIAAYIGASNGDQPEFYDLFVAGMNNIGIGRCHHITASFGDHEKEALEAAELILLAGGEVKKGWDILVKTGIKDIILRKYMEGALLMGISAGAIQLTPEGLGIFPFLLGAHEEEEDWQNLQTLIELSLTIKSGIGLPYGSAIKYHPDHNIQVLTKPVLEFVSKEGRISRTLLFSEKIV